MEQKEVQVDVSHDRRRFFPREQRAPFFVPGTQVDIEVPFEGDKNIFRFKTKPFSFDLPAAEVQQGRLRLTITQPHDCESELFKTEYEGEIKLIRKHIERANRQVANYNENLRKLSKQEVSLRRDRLKRHDNIATILDIPLVARPGAPSIEPVKVEFRRPRALPVLSNTKLIPEPGITGETFEYILSCIRHQGRTFERTPSTFAVHGEEDIRNLILANLNGYFQGGAVGEAFRCNGKTDICIEQRNRAAFVGECKLWSGPVSFTAALNQLFSYLTWRDCKTALIIFNMRNKNFEKVIKAIPTNLRKHPLFHSEVPCEEVGEWRTRIFNGENKGQIVTVHTFVFNLYCAA